MDMQLDARVTELLCARLCHDLISPIAAINNGIELITELGEDLKGDAMELIAGSAKAASNKLQFFRVAFGSARSASGEGIGLAEARERALASLGGDRIAIDWPTPQPDGPQFAREGVKLILNLVLLATEVLPGAGTVQVSLHPADAGCEVRVTAAKDGITLHDELAAAIAGTAEVAELTPRTVQAYYTALLARLLGTSLSVERGESAIELFCTIPVAR